MTTSTGRLVSDVMTPAMITVTPDTSVFEAAEAMREHNIGDVLVMDDGRVTGVVTDRDLAIRVLGNRLDPGSTVVGDVCSSDVVGVPPETDVGAAVSLMRERAIRRLPVVGPDGRCHGVVTIGDLAVTQDPTSALADISAAPPNV